LGSRIAACGLGAVLTALAFPVPLGAWGGDGHRLVNSRAVEALPAELRALFEPNVAYLAEHSVDPDLWRRAGLEGEEPNHFLDMDAFGGPPFDIPDDEAEHLARHGAAARERGRVPWRSAEEQRALVEAFRSRDVPAVLRHAAVLGHYVADAHQPLHAALNYDGQLSDQRGVHSRWESRVVTRFLKQLEPRVRPSPQEPALDARALVLQALRESFGETAGLLASDIESVHGPDLAATAQDDRYDDLYYSRLYAAEGNRLVRRLTAAAERLAALWYGAWVEAGRPALPHRVLAHVRGARRGVLVSLDGAGERLLRAAIERGSMPNLARIRRAGATASGVVTSRPAKTAAGHAALFTGAWPERNGIAGNGLLPPGAPVTTVERGFLSTRLRAEPIWVTAARQGLSATVAAGTQVWPFTPYLAERRFGADYGRSLTLFDGYPTDGWAGGKTLTGSDVVAREPAGWDAEAPTAGARELTLELLGVTLQGLLFDDPDDPATGYDSLLVAPDRRSTDGVVLKPARAGDPLALKSLRVDAGGQVATVHLRLFELGTGGDPLLLWASTPYPLRSNHPLAAAAALEASGGFFGNGASGAYARGLFGPTLWQGGDGLAEERYLETAAHVVERFERLDDFCFERTDWSLLVTYLPYPDEVFHLWLGRLDPDLEGNDAALARRLLPYLDRALGLVDGYVAHLESRLGPEGVLAIGSDHGQIASRRSVQPNRVLAAAGLLATDARGALDLSRTLATYYAGNSGRVVVNRADRASGVVPADQVDQVLERATAALRAATDPGTGAPLFTGVMRIGDELELVAAPGYDASPGLAGEPVVERAPAGVHLFGPERAEMHASFTVSGAGVAGGADLGVIRQIDVAPTLAALLGLEPPRDAEGEVLRGALSPDSP